MERHFRALDVALTLAGPDDVIEPIAYAYRRFLTDARPPSAVRLALAEDRIEIDGRSLDLIPQLDPGLQLYQQFLNTLMDRIAGHAVLHAGALADPAGGAVILAAPSGHGKTSLTLELASRGLGFLSDDFAPLDLERRLVAPYPRTVGVIPGEDAPIPDAFREKALAPDAVRLFGKSLLDVGLVLGEDALHRDSAPLRHVIQLASHEAEGPVRPVSSWVDLAARPKDAPELDALFSSVEGVETISSAQQPHLHFWRLRLDHAKQPTMRLNPVFDGDKVVLFEKHWDVKPDFSRPPQAVRIKRRQAAETLGREMLNRRGSGRLLARYDGNLMPLFLDLAGALREAECWSVNVGECRATADLVQELIAR